APHRGCAAEGIGVRTLDRHVAPSIDALVRDFLGHRVVRCDVLLRDPFAVAVNLEAAEHAVSNLAVAHLPVFGPDHLVKTLLNGAGIEVGQSLPPGVVLRPGADPPANGRLWEGLSQGNEGRLEPRMGSVLGCGVLAHKLDARCLPEVHYTPLPVYFPSQAARARRHK